MKKESKNSKKYSFNYLLDVVSDAFITAIKKVNKFLTDKKKNVIVKIIVRIICCLIMLAILEVPFFIVGRLGVGIIYLLSTTMREVLSAIWISAIDYTYCIFSLIVLFKVIYDMSKSKKYKMEIKESTKIGDNLYYVAETILRIMITVSLIPLILMDFMLFAVFGMLICFVTHGIYVFGPFLIVIGLIVMVTSSLSYISDIVLFDKGGDK